MSKILTLFFKWWFFKNNKKRLFSVFFSPYVCHTKAEAPSPLGREAPAASPSGWLSSGSARRPRSLACASLASLTHADHKLGSSVKGTICTTQRPLFAGLWVRDRWPLRESLRCPFETRRGQKCHVEASHRNTGGGAHNMRHCVLFLRRATEHLFDTAP